MSIAKAAPTRAQIPAGKAASRRSLVQPRHQTFFSFSYWK